MDLIGHGHVHRVAETSIAWWEIGEGEPLVLMHGVGDCHRTWRRVAPILAERYRVLMPDLPGHGLSGKPDAPYTIPWFASTMHAWLDTIGLGQVKLVGHSYGGGVAQWMLLENHERITRLALVAPGGFGRDVALGLRLSTFPLLGSALTPAFIGHGTRLMMRFGLGARAAVEREEIERLVWMNNSPGSGLAFHRTLANTINMFGQYLQTSHRIEEIPSLPPIAIFWGGRDAILPIEHAHHAMARIEGAELVSYPEAGHCPHLDDSEAFARDLMAFLERPAERPVRLVPEAPDARRGSGRRASFESAVARLGGLGAKLRRAARQGRQGKAAA
jgi:pimeloyl-ACP methyl ester carboxylesterase